MQELINKLKEFKILYDTDREFFSVIDDLRYKNESNLYNYEREKSLAKKAKAKETYLLEMAEGLKVEASFLGNSSVMYNLLEEIMTIVDSLPTEIT